MSRCQHYDYDEIKRDVKGSRYGLEDPPSIPVHKCKLKHKPKPFQSLIAGDNCDFYNRQSECPNYIKA